MQKVHAASFHAGFEDPGHRTGLNDAFAIDYASCLRIQLERDPH